MKKAAIIADGGSKIGFGHIMRTIPIAKMLSQKYYVYYVCSDGMEFSEGRNLVKNFGFDFYLNGDDISGNLAVIDSYDIDEMKLKSYRNFYEYIMYIDDLHCLDFYDTDFLLNRNIGAESLLYNCRENCCIMLGGKYTILGDSFRNADYSVVSENVSNIVITMGGADPFNCTPILLQFVKELNFNFKVIIGNGFSNDNINSIKSISKCENNVELLFSPDMCGVLSSADLVITACGGTMYELAALGVPAVGIAVADNQIEAAENAGRKGIIFYAGVFSRIKKEEFNSSLCSICKDYKKRNQISLNQKKLINKNGLDLIIHNLEKCFID